MLKHLKKSHDSNFIPADTQTLLLRCLDGPAKETEVVKDHLVLQDTVKMQKFITGSTSAFT